MIEKYQQLMSDVYCYIYNSVQVEEDDSKIAKEIVDRYPVFVTYFKCDNEMIFEFILQSVIMVRKTIEMEKGNKAV